MHLTFKKKTPVALSEYNTILQNTISHKIRSNCVGQIFSEYFIVFFWFCTAFKEMTIHKSTFLQRSGFMYNHFFKCSTKLKKYNEVF